MLFKNTAGGCDLYFHNVTTGLPVTGDASNISVTISKDGAASASSSNSVSETGGGVYSLALTAAETNADRLAIIPSSSTSNVVGSPIIAYTTGGAVPAAAAGGNGGLPTVDASNHVAGSVTTDALVTTVDSVADGLATTLGTAGAGLTDLGGMSTAMKAEVNVEADTALSDYDAPTKAEMDAKFSTTDGLITTLDTVADGLATTLGTAGAGLTDLGGMSTGMKAEVNAEVDTALGDYDAPTKAEMDAKFSTTDGLITTVDGVADGIATTLGTAGAGLTDLGGMSTGMKAEVNAEVDTALGDYDAPTKAEMDAKFSTTDALITAVDGVADGIATTLGTAGAGLTDLGGMSTGMKAEVNTEVDTALSDYDAPTKAEMDSKFSTTDGLITTVDGVADGIATTLGTAGAGLTDLGGMSTAMKAEVNAEVDTALSDYDAPTKAEMDAKFSTTDGLISTVDTVVDSISSTLSSGVTVATISDGAIGAAAVADIWSTTAIAESYASDGSTGTGAQLLYQIQQALTEFAISSTTLTVKRLDGSTTASTYTLDDASAPTSRTRAS